MKTTNMLRAPLALFADGGTESRSFKAICSTNEINTYGYRIDQKGWDLRRFANGGPVLLEHNAAESLFGGHNPEMTLPIGRATDVRVEGGVLRATITIASSAVHPLADRVLAGIREKVLVGISVGAMPLDQDDEGNVKRAELMEISVCAMPADAGARIELSATRDTSPPDLRWRGKGWARLSSLEKLAFFRAEPGRARRAYQAHHAGKAAPLPTKPYARMTLSERHAFAVNHPEAFAKAHAAHHRKGGPSAA